MDIRIHTRFEIGERVFFTDPDTGELSIGEVFKVSVNRTETRTRLVYCVMTYGLGKKKYVTEDLILRRIIPDHFKCADCKRLWSTPCGELILCQHILCGKTFIDEKKGIRNPYKTKCIFHSKKQ